MTQVSFDERLPSRTGRRLGADHFMVGAVRAPRLGWHFTLADEPHPDTYFDFPIDEDL